MNAKTEFTIFTAEGVSFTAAARTLVGACKKAAVPNEYEIVAVVASDCVARPAPGKLTALIVNPPRSGIGL